MPVTTTYFTERITTTISWYPEYSNYLLGTNGVTLQWATHKLPSFLLQPGYSVGVSGWQLLNDILSPPNNIGLIEGEFYNITITRSGYPTQVLLRRFIGYDISVDGGRYGGQDKDRIPKDGFYIRPSPGNPFTHFWITVGWGNGGSYINGTINSREPINWWNSGIYTTNSSDWTVSEYVAPANISSIPDTNYKTINRVNLDTAQTPESITVVMIYRISQLDELALQELFSRQVTYNRNYQDQIVATDDILGAANVDDEQTASVSKIFVENKTVSELFSRQVTYNRNYQDQVISTDDVLGAASIDDEQIVTVSKVFTENTAVSELFSRQVTYNRNYQDQIVATDDILGAANVDDEQTASVLKIFIENTAISDLLTKTVNPKKSDNVVTQETRSAHIQSYFSTGDYVDKSYLGLTPII